MSADNWTHCPRCTREGEQRIAELSQAITVLYGKVPIEQFDNSRKKLASEIAQFNIRDETFREDYEIYGAETGVVTVDYNGTCTECGLTLHFTYIQPIPGFE